MGGSRGGLRRTITPGAGRWKSLDCAHDTGPRLLNRKAVKTSIWAYGVLFISILSKAYKYKKARFRSQQGKTLSKWLGAEIISVI
jgi:hypothetical protein